MWDEGDKKLSRMAAGTKISSSLSIGQASAGPRQRLSVAELPADSVARPLAAELSKIENRTVPLAILGLSRETQYGLQFYRNQDIARYELGQAPIQEHLVIAPEGSQVSVAKWTVGRRVTYLGSFAPQGVDYYWVEGRKIEER